MKLVTRTRSPEKNFWRRKKKARGGFQKVNAQKNQSLEHVNTRGGVNVFFRKLRNCKARAIVQQASFPRKGQSHLGGDKPTEDPKGKKAREWADVLPTEGTAKRSFVFHPEGPSRQRSFIKSGGKKKDNPVHWRERGGEGKEKEGTGNAAQLELTRKGGTCLSIMAHWSRKMRQGGQKRPDVCAR